MKVEQIALFPETSQKRLDTTEFAAELHSFRDFDKVTRIEDFPDPEVELPVFVNEFWTSKQRAASSLHEISYRACFKPQLPRFFISRLTNPGEVVYDPFMGRGTTLLEAGFLGRRPAGCDINPLSKILLEPRLNPPSLDMVAHRLDEISLEQSCGSEPDELLAFYHPKTLQKLCTLRNYLMIRDSTGELDSVDAWIRMIATNRLTGHSSGFFSVYTLPPNQAVTVKSQLKINQKRQQTPPVRDIKAIILKKTKTLLNKTDPAQIHLLREQSRHAQILTGSCNVTPEISDNSVSLVVTSPPFLDVVNYQKDNWLRCWFNGLDASQISIWQLKKTDDWSQAMTSVFRELHRILIPGGHIAFEVGEVRGGKLLMETLVVPSAKLAGLVPELVLVNDQIFTKTSNCWGVSNLSKGTNTNRVVLLRKNKED